MLISQSTRFSELQSRLHGQVLTDTDEAWDSARQTFNVLVDQRPAAVVRVANADDVAETIRYAAQRGLRIAPQGTGHNAGPMDGLEDALLLRTDALQGVEIDVAARRARVGAGVRWGAVADPASEAGLAPLSGSSRNVGVAGYSLGGGMGWLGRKHGLQANALTAVEIVTADGELRRIDHDNETDLFWAVRGGGGNYGVVTALEFELFPAPEIYAGRCSSRSSARRSCTPGTSWSRQGSPTRSRPSRGCTSSRRCRCCRSSSAASRSPWSRPRTWATSVTAPT